VSRGDATTRRTRGAREVEWEAMAQHEKRGHATAIREDGAGGDTATNHGRERQWKVAVAELQVDGRKHTS
jgi:hypothetical protein